MATAGALVTDPQRPTVHAPVGSEYGFQVVQTSIPQVSIGPGRGILLMLLMQLTGIVPPGCRLCMCTSCE